MLRVRLLISLLCAGLLLTVAPAWALPGDAAAVIRHCGEPHAENFTTSQVTNRPQRDLIYNAVTLHFEPAEGGWSFTTAWRGHFPVGRGQLEKSLPCFRAAMQEVGSTPTPYIDPTIATQTTLAKPGTTTHQFGIQFLWLIVALVVVMIILLAIPRRRVEPMHRVPENRPYRLPNLRNRFFRRRTDKF